MQPQTLQKQRIQRYTITMFGRYNAVEVLLMPRQFNVECYDAVWHKVRLVPAQVDNRQVFGLVVLQVDVSEQSWHPALPSQMEKIVTRLTESESESES